MGLRRPVTPEPTKMVKPYPRTAVDASRQNENVLQCSLMPNVPPTPVKRPANAHPSRAPSIGKGASGSKPRTPPGGGKGMPTPTGSPPAGRGDERPRDPKTKLDQRAGMIRGVPGFAEATAVREPGMRGPQRGWAPHLAVDPSSPQRCWRDLRLDQPSAPIPASL